MQPTQFCSCPLQQLSASLKSATTYHESLCIPFQQKPPTALVYSSHAEEASAVKAAEDISECVKINSVLPYGEELLPFSPSEPQNPSSNIMMDYF